MDDPAKVMVAVAFFGSIALEVERISEGQRFTTKLLSEHNQMLPKASRQLTSNPPT
jgi:hypothetical protein